MHGVLYEIVHDSIAADETPKNNRIEDRILSRVFGLIARVCGREAEKLKKFDHSRVNSKDVYDDTYFDRVVERESLYNDTHFYRGVEFDRINDDGYYNDVYCDNDLDFEVITDAGMETEDDEYQYMNDPSDDDVKHSCSSRFLSLPPAVDQQGGEPSEHQDPHGDDRQGEYADGRVREHLRQRVDADGELHGADQGGSQHVHTRWQPDQAGSPAEFDGEGVGNNSGHEEQRIRPGVRPEPHVLIAG